LKESMTGRAAVRAVLFDLDGTLLDTLDDLAESMNAVLRRHGLPLHSNDEYKLYVGDGIENLVRRSLPSGVGDAAMVAGYVAGMRAAYLERWDRISRPYQGVPEMLAALQARGLRMAVLSNKPQAMTDLCVDKLLEGFVFDEVRGARADVPKKPDPTAALEIAKAVDTPPCEWLYLGDTGTDMRTAVAAGMYPVGALWGFRDASELSGDGARSLIAAPHQLIEMVDDSY
jgi:phosphoglycolate phosphatase